MDLTYRCGHCLDDLEDGKPETLDKHLKSCPKYRRPVGLEREGWDTPADAA